MGKFSGRLIVEDERAELGTGAMIIFIALILAAAVVGSVIVMATEKMFQEQNSDAHASTEVFGGIPVIVRIEISQLGATDEFDVVFELIQTAQGIFDNGHVISRLEFTLTNYNAITFIFH